ncbi:MAG: glucose-6-phosphate isomerase, partial [Propionibacteriales bacterium]|nr:glucose-6-phosphate isomerase [Propionibacteriales bacterium]
MTEPTVDIRSAGLAAETEPLVSRLVQQRVASALAAADPTLWGTQAQHEAAKRLSWVRLPETSRPLLADIEALRRQLHA